VAVEDAVELDGQRKLAQGERPLVPELRRGDRAGDRRPVARLGLRCADGRRDLALAVAAHPVGGHAQLLQAVERGARERPRHRVPADHHRVELGRPWVGEHRVERVDVAVNVVEGENLHARDTLSRGLGIRRRAPRVAD
jgi:hypothetical protein